MEVKSLRSNVLVKILPITNRKYKNLIHIPDTSKKDDVNYIGVVESFGEGRKNKKGHLLPLDLNLGDLVLFARHTGTRLMIDGVEYRYLRFNDIIAAVDEE